MLILDITTNDKGQLYTHKTTLSNGLFLNIKHTICNKLSMVTKQINFTHLSFNRLGDRFLACDLHGTIYMFDINYNRYMRLNRLGITCTALAYNLKCKTEYLVACIDGTIKCFNTETRDLVGWMKGHEKAIISLSVHPTTADMVISFSSDLAQLWDLKTFECKQKLCIDSKKNVEIVKICFAPTTNDIISVFKDDSIYVWTSENVSLKCQFNTEETEQKHFYKCVSISGDGKVLVVGSRHNYVDILNIESKSFVKRIELADEAAGKQAESTIKDCILLPGFCYENKLLIVLTQEGKLNVYNVDSGQMVANFNSVNQTYNQSQLVNEQKLIQIYCSPSSRYFAGISQDGFIQLYDLDSSFIKTMKSTSNMMKSATVNSTSSRFLNETAANKQHSASKLKQQQQLQQKHNVSKRTLNLLNNEQIYLKLVRILKCYNEYPARYRLFIWKLLLKLPENYESYASFVERGTHPAYYDLAKKYPLKSQKCIRLLERTLSALAHWSPIFAECDYLALLIFPFVKLFQNNQVVCFEIVATLINNWCQHWFEFFPNPPINILTMVENILACHDRILLDHFMRYRITCQIYGWCLLETIFSEVFSKTEWLILFDNIFSNHPGFMLYLVAAYSVCNRTALIQIKEIEDAKYFFRHRNPVSVRHLLNEAFKMQKCTPSDIDPCKLLKSFEPLTKGTYPVFNKQPRFVSDYQIIEKSKILKQEIEYLKEREAHLESHKLTEGKKLENEYLLKQMLWEKSQNQINNKLYKQSVEEYEKKHKKLEEIRLRSQQNTPSQPSTYPIGLKNIPVTVGGEPVSAIDQHGNTFFNKMKKIEENFDEIQHIISKTREINQEDMEENFEINNEDDLKEIESEILANRADALLSSNMNENDKLDKNPSSSRAQNYSSYNDSNLSSQVSFERGRGNIEEKEMDAMKRIYQLRQTLALENRKQNKIKTTVES